MNKALIIILFTTKTIPIYSQVQVDTIYFNSKWERVSAEKHTYFRVFQENEKGVFDSKDFWSDGTIQMTGHYESFDPQIRVGEFVFYYKNGNQKQRSTYSDNKVVGEVFLYNQDGSLDLSYCPYLDSLDNPEDIHRFIPKIHNHVRKKLTYPETAYEKGIQCSIQTIFFVSPEGKLKRFEANECNEEILNEEAKRVLSSFKKWPVAIYKGKPTHLYFTMPINFKME